MTHYQVEKQSGLRHHENSVNLVSRLVPSASDNRI